MIKEVALSFIKHHIIIKAKSLEHGKVCYPCLHSKKKLSNRSQGIVCGKHAKIICMEQDLFNILCYCVFLSCFCLA